MIKRTIKPAAGTSRITPEEALEWARYARRVREAREQRAKERLKRARQRAAAAKKR
ncbi:MAG TPA: hypothetical protein VGR02_19005 [Thermoanaerobaculia bacterium]|jgi:hypothetical protein|nr:hypothetical protein [Thermoanaerobaculia bacterium]